MKTILTIDFDIIMGPSIELYNDSDENASSFFAKFNFLGIPPANLSLYTKLTKYLLNQPIEKITLMENHHEIVGLTKGDGPFHLINIDHHHDLGYGDNIRWNQPITQVDVGNWVKKLWDLNRIVSYNWINNITSINDLPSRAKKFITEEHLINNYKLPSDIEHIYISYSSEWIPEYYQSLFEIWKELFYKEIELDETEDGQLIFDL